MIRASQAKPIVDESVWQRHYLHHKRERYNEKFVLYKEVFERYLEPGGTCFEIGFLPGYILTYLSKHFRYTVSGIDLTPFDETEVRERMVLDGANVGKLFRGDFLQFASDEEYDVVCSFGFLEHFSNPEVIIKRHISLLRPEGHWSFPALISEARNTSYTATWTQRTSPITTSKPWILIGGRELFTRTG